MIKLLTKWIIFAFVIMATCYLPGISVDSFYSALIIAIALTIINVIVKPILKLLAFPINLLTFGLFNLIINYGILYLVAYFIPQYKLENPISAFFASIIIAISYCILKKCGE